MNIITSIKIIVTITDAIVRAEGKTPFNRKILWLHLRNKLRIRINSSLDQPDNLHTYLCRDYEDIMQIESKVNL